jgi:hypothetical protein
MGEWKLVSAALVIGMLSAAAPAEILSRGHSPSGTLMVAPASGYWEVWSEGTEVISGAQVLLDGVEVQAGYSAAERRLTFSLPAALGPGNHEIEARALFQRGFSIKNKWTFRVEVGSGETLVELDDGQKLALSCANEFRMRLGLDALVPDARLSASSLAHSQYNSRHSTTGHFQKPEAPGFVGQGPAERAAAFGFPRGVYEAVTCGTEDIPQAVQALIDAPYHRLPFLQPGSLAFGAGYCDQRLTLTFELTAERGTIVYPFDGQTDVPTAWGRAERPNPLRIHPGANGIVGYPITLAHFAGPARLKAIRAELKDSKGESVPFYLNTPDNDSWLRNAAVILPRRPLNKGETYSVRVEAETENGDSIARAWSFTTSAETSRTTRREAAPGASAKTGMKQLAQRLRLLAKTPALCP